MEKALEVGLPTDPLEVPPPELTLADLAGQLDLACKTIAALMLMASGYPMPREALLVLVKSCGIEIDETMAFRPKSIIQAPSGVIGKKH